MLTITQKIMHPLKLFFRDSRAVGISLIVSTIISLILSNNNTTNHWYQKIWSWNFSGKIAHHFQIGSFNFPNSPVALINDFLMAIFFFLAGMEIKRELTNGELASRKKAVLPIAAAVGGMVTPALIFSIFNWGTSYKNGWAIPMATDIAFTLGVASLLGKKIPLSLKVFLTALAIIDDLGAIVVIALFYGGHIHLFYLSIVIVIMLLLWIFNKFSIQFGWFYWLLGFILWYCMFNSGIHASVAGVVFAFFIPVSLLNKLELKLHFPVYFIIIPIFALANTAITIPPHIEHQMNQTLSWGIIIGLLIGKPLGIVTASFIMVKLKWAQLPLNTNWYKMAGAGILAGIGFTMSIFLSTISFVNTIDQNIAKISVLITSILAMVVGFCWFLLQFKSSTIHYK